jgi:hypothetical protein
MAGMFELLKRSMGTDQKENRPSQYKYSVPWFQAAQDEDGETFKANQAFRRDSRVVFALPTFRNIHGHSPRVAPDVSL